MICVLSCYYRPVEREKLQIPPVLCQTEAVPSLGLAAQTDRKNRPIIDLSIGTAAIQIHLTRIIVDIKNIFWTAPENMKLPIDSEDINVILILS